MNAEDLDNRLLAGDVDIDAQGIGVQAAARAKILSSPSLKKDADAAPGNREWFTYINTKVAPLNNVNCRQAVEYAANKTDLQTAWGGPYAGGQIATHAAAAGHGRVHARSTCTTRRASPTGDLDRGEGGAGQVRPAERLHGRRVVPQRPAGRGRGRRRRCRRRWPGWASQLQLHGYPSGTYYTDFAGAPNYVHQHNLGILMGGWSPDWPDGYGMMDELINGNTIVPRATPTSAS